MGQLSKQILERSASTFQGDTVVNPGEDCKVIQLRSGKVAGSETKVNEESVEKESHQEEEVEIEEACKEVEEFTEEHKGVELTRPLSKPSPSNTTFKWVKFLPLILTFPLEYGLLETDGQLRALCGIKSKRKMVSDKELSSKVQYGCMLQIEVQGLV